MSSLVAERQGAQRPSRQLLPRGKVTSSGPEAVELAASAGLILDDWQAWVLEEALAERSDGLWAAFECALIVPRQNGKGSILEALELYHLFVLGSRLVVHSAHEFKTAREHFLRIKELIRGTPELFEQVEHIYDANGAESVLLRNGCRLNFVARSKGSTRGFTGDLIVWDEAYNLPQAAVGAMGPTLSAIPNPQVWYTSSAPHSDSHVLWNVMRRGELGQEDRLFFAFWGNDTVPEDEDAAMVNVNPGWPHRLTKENLKAEKQMLAGLGDEWARERLGVPSPEDTTAGVFPPGVWAACLDPQSKVETPAAIALDVSPGMGFASFAVAGRRSDGLDHVELIERHPGTAWVLERAKHYFTEYRIPISLDPRGPVAGIVDDLKSAGVQLDEIADGQLPRACAALQESVLTGKVRHLGQAPLDNAVHGAAIRVQGDSWRWGRSASQVDISPLVAVTIALSVKTGGPATFIDLADYV